MRISASDWLCVCTYVCVGNGEIEIATTVCSVKCAMYCARPPRTERNLPLCVCGNLTLRVFSGSNNSNTTLSDTLIKSTLLFVVFFDFHTEISWKNKHQRQRYAFTCVYVWNIQSRHTHTHTHLHAYRFQIHPDFHFADKMCVCIYCEQALYICCLAQRERFTFDGMYGELRCKRQRVKDLIYIYFCC